MLDMGFLPDIRRVLKHLPAEAADAVLLARRCRRRSCSSRARCCRTRSRSTSSARRRRPSGITQAVYPGPAGPEGRRCSSSCCKRGDMKNALVFTRTKHRANRLAEQLDASKGSPCARIHGNRSQAQRTEALAGFKNGRYRVLVATDIAARGIDVEALGARRQLRRAARARGLHPPRRPHGARRADRRRLHVRVAGGRDGPRAIERAIGKRLPRVTVPDFDYRRRPPSASRCRSPSASPRSARARPSERARAKEKAERRPARCSRHAPRLPRTATASLGPVARPGRPATRSPRGPSVLRPERPAQVAPSYGRRPAACSRASAVALRRA